MSFCCPLPPTYCQRLRLLSRDQWLSPGSDNFIRQKKPYRADQVLSVSAGLGFIGTRVISQCPILSHIQYISQNEMHYKLIGIVLLKLYQLQNPMPILPIMTYYLLALYLFFSSFHCNFGSGSLQLCYPVSLVLSSTNRSP